MPIYERGYQRYAGLRRPHGRAWQVIARTGVRGVLRDRRFLGLFLLAWAPFVMRAVQVYLAVAFDQAFLQVTAATFREFLGQQEVFVFFVTIYVGAGLIAGDRRANALQVYLSKPVTRAEYVAGKLVVLLTFLCAVTWLPAMMLLLVQVVLTGPAFLRANTTLIPAITLFSLIQMSVSTCAMLALSALSKSSRFVAVTYAGLLLFTASVSNTVRAITGSASLAWLSPSSSLQIVGDAIFRIPHAPGNSPAIAVASLAVIAAGSIVIIGRRVRAVDVIV